MEKESRKINLIKFEYIEEENFFEIHLILKPLDNHTKNFLDYYSQEYSSSYTFNSIEEYEEYIKELCEYKVLHNSSINEPKLSYGLNPFKILEYNSEENVFVFHEYIEKNLMTKAGLKLLGEYKKGIEPNTFCVDEQYLISIIEGLYNFCY